MPISCCANLILNILIESAVALVVFTEYRERMKAFVMATSNKNYIFVVFSALQPHSVVAP